MPNDVEQDPDRELERLLGNAGERCSDDEADGDDEDHCGHRGERGQPQRFCAAPKVSTMKTTSSSSSNTLLNEIVNEYQSIFPIGCRAARSASAIFGLYAAASSRLALTPAARKIAL